MHCKNQADCEYAGINLTAGMQEFMHCQYGLYCAGMVNEGSP